MINLWWIKFFLTIGSFSFGSFNSGFVFTRPASSHVPNMLEELNNDVMAFSVFFLCIKFTYSSMGLFWWQSNFRNFKLIKDTNLKFLWSIKHMLRVSVVVFWPIKPTLLIEMYFTLIVQRETLFITISLGKWFKLKQEYDICYMNVGQHFANKENESFLSGLQIFMLSFKKCIHCTKIV